MWGRERVAEPSRYARSCIIVHLRLLTSAYLRTHADDFVPFLFALEDDPRFVQGGSSGGGGPPTMENFCQLHVEPVQREADHLQIVALSRALSTPLRIAYLDQSQTFAPEGEGEEGGGGAVVNFIEFECDTAGSDDAIEGALLYRPGHYDILSR